MHTGRLTATFENIENIKEAGKRVRIVGTVIKKFIAPDGKYSFLVIDDGTETMRAKAFGSKLLDAFAEGDFIQLIGMVVVSGGEETYIKPEIASNLTPNEYYFLRIQMKKSDNKMLELLKKSPNKTIEEICAELKIPNEQCVEELKSLLEEGTIYEPTKGKYAVVL